MFFWMFLASFMGVIMFGDFLDSTKSQEVFVAPIYEAFALNMLQQHNAADYGYQDMRNTDLSGLNAYINTAGEGVVPLITVEDGEASGVSDSNTIFSYIERRLPVTFNPQNGTRSYLYCIDKEQSAIKQCGDDNVVRYVMTIRAIPPRYDGSSKTAVLDALADVMDGSRSVGLLQDAGSPLEDSGTTMHQPLGSRFLILSSGVAPINLPYIPNYLICKTPLSNSASSTKMLGDDVKYSSYLVTMSLDTGLDPGENLTAGSLSCAAVE